MQSSISLHIAVEVGGRGRNYPSFFPLVLLLLGNIGSTVPEEGAVPCSHELAPEMLFCHHVLLSSAS